MSASAKAKPLGTKGWRDDEKKPIDPKDARKILPRIECSCGFRGSICDLLADDDDETMWCPECETSAWQYS